MTEPDWSAAGFSKPPVRSEQSVEGTVLPIPEFALAIERALKEKNLG